MTASSLSFLQKSYGVLINRSITRQFIYFIFFSFPADQSCQTLVLHFVSLSQ